MAKKRQPCEQFLFSHISKESADTPTPYYVYLRARTERVPVFPSLLVFPLNSLLAFHFAVRDAPKRKARAIFSRIDHDASGKLEFDEVKLALFELGADATDREVHQHCRLCPCALTLSCVFSFSLHLPCALIFVFRGCFAFLVCNFYSNDFFFSFSS